MCQICQNEYEGLNYLNIKDCDNITNIPNIENLKILHIYNCQNLTNVPYASELFYLNIRNCQALINIPNLENLTVLEITNCNNIKNIPNIENLKGLYINNCKNIINCNIHIIDNYNITKFYNSNKIKKWYKKRAIYNKYITSINQMIELVVMIQMDPHNENNTYLQNIIKEFSYEE